MQTTKREKGATMPTSRKATHDTDAFRNILAIRSAGVENPIDERYLSALVPTGAPKKDSTTPKLQALFHNPDWLIGEVTDLLEAQREGLSEIASPDMTDQDRTAYEIVYHLQMASELIRFAAEHAQHHNTTDSATPESADALLDCHDHFLTSATSASETLNHIANKAIDDNLDRPDMIRKSAKHVRPSSDAAAELIAKYSGKPAHPPTPEPEKPQSYTQLFNALDTNINTLDKLVEFEQTQEQHHLRVTAKDTKATSSVTLECLTLARQFIGEANERAQLWQKDINQSQRQSKGGGVGGR